MRKKLTGLFLTAAMVVCTAVTALAAPSPSVTGTVSSVSEATDANGNAITATLSENFTEEAQAAVDTLKTDAGLKEALGADYNENMAVLDVKEVTVPEGTVFPATLTFNVSGVNASTKGQFLHWNNGAWEKIAATFGTNTMTGTFNSLSPVAFVIDKTTAATGTTGTTSTTSPKTGESAAPMAAALIAVLAMGGAFVVKRKMA